MQLWDGDWNARGTRSLFYQCRGSQNFLSILASKFSWWSTAAVYTLFELLWFFINSRRVGCWVRTLISALAFLTCIYLTTICFPAGVRFCYPFLNGRSWVILAILGLRDCWRKKKQWCTEKVVPGLLGEHGCESCNEVRRCVSSRFGGKWFVRACSRVSRKLRLDAFLLRSCARIKYHTIVNAWFCVLFIYLWSVRAKMILLRL